MKYKILAWLNTLFNVLVMSLIYLIIAVALSRFLAWIFDGDADKLAIICLALLSGCFSEIVGRVGQLLKDFEEYLNERN